MHTDDFFFFNQCYYLAYCAFCSRQKGPATQRLCWCCSPVSTLGNWGHMFCVLGQGVRNQGFIRRSTAFLNIARGLWKQRKAMTERLCPCCLLGTVYGIHGLCLHTGIIWSRAGVGPKLTLGCQQLSSAGKLEPPSHCPFFFSCTDTVSEELRSWQPGELRCAYIASDHKHKNALNHNQMATICS